MIGEDDAFAEFALEASADLAREVEFLLDPLGDGFDEGCEAGGGKGEITFEQAVEFEEGFVVEGDKVDLVGG